MKTICPIRLMLPICLMASITLGAAYTPTPPAVAVEPVIDTPMQAPSICRGPDGAYYLTGTVSSEVGRSLATLRSQASLRSTSRERRGGFGETALPDFQNNDGIFLWKSADLKSWQPLGQVWSIEKNAAKDSWQKQKRPVRHPASGIRDRSERVRGMVSPEIVYLAGTYWITYSMNGWGCGLLKSTSGKAEGPYEDLGRIIPEGESASLFEDEDGSIYLTFDEGWVAKMKDDMTGVAEQPKLVMPRSGSDLGNAPFRVGRMGAQLFKRNGVYYLGCAEWTSRTGRPMLDSFVASSKSVYGPYDCRHLLCDNSGETTVFSDGEGQWYCTVSGQGIGAKHPNRAGIAPLEWTKGELYFGRGVKDEVPSKPQHIITERGPWEYCRPLTDDIIRDVTSSVVHDDGYIYYAGTCYTEGLENQIPLWRFKADDAAKVGCGEMQAERRVVMHFKDLHWLDFENRQKYGQTKRPYGMSWGLTRNCMDGKVFFLKGTFYMTFNLYTSPGTSKNPTLDGGKTFTHGSGCIRSTSGTWEGPWESVAKAPYSHTQLRVDEEGRIITQRGWKGVMYLDEEEMTFKVLKSPESLAEIQYPKQGMTYCDDGSAFAGTPYDEVFKNYRWTSTEWNGTTALHIEQRPASTYDRSISWSESGEMEGPYPRCLTTIPHGGGAGWFKDQRGRYWHMFFGNDSTSPWFERMGIIPLDVHKEGAQYIVRIADEWPED